MTRRTPVPMDRLERIHSRPTVVVGACGALLAATTAVAFAQDDPGNAAPSALEGPTIRLVADVGAVTTVDLGRPGQTPGDLYAFRAAVRDASGNEVGRVLGTQTIMRVGRRVATVQAAGTFELPGGQIAFGGLSGYPRAEAGNVPGRTYVRPILGGTGAYAGVGGTVATTRRDDGRYDQRLDLVAPRAGAALRFSASTGAGEATVLHVGAPDTHEGDLRVVSAPVDAHEGGFLRGLQTTVLTEGAEEAIAAPQLTFETPGGQLAIGGLSRRAADGHLVAGQELVSPVLGGTGDWAGRAGTVTTTHVGGGRYEQRFELAPAGRPAGRLRLTSRPRGAEHHLDLGTRGTSAGDLTVFSWPVVDRRGRRQGRVHGIQTTIDRDRRAVTVDGRLTFSLKRGDLVVGGLSDYPTHGPGLRVGRSYERPILGGTGRYAGMRGTVTSVRRKNGSYEQRFRLLRP